MKGEGEASFQDYLGEAEDILEALQQRISEWKPMVENGGIKRAEVDEIFRYIHSLKGLSSSFALAEIVELCQLIEQILILARLNTSFIDEDKHRLIIHLVDTLYKGLGAISRGRKAELSLDKRKREVEDILNQAKSDTRVDYKAKIDISRRILKSLTHTEEERLFNDINQGKAVFQLEVKTSPVKLKDILHNINLASQPEGEMLAHIPLPIPNKPGQMKVLCLISTSNKEFDSTIKQTLPKYKLRIRPIKQKPSASSVIISERSDSSTWSSLRKISSTIRVNISRLNRLQEAMVELSLAKAYLEEINRKYYEVQGYNPFFRENTQALDTLERRMRYLQERIIESRLVPIGQIFNKLNRSISKMLLNSNKAIQLISSGSETELDGTLVEQLSDPLMHIIRNAIDHGIEPKETRKQKGKEEEGKIFLRAYPQGSKIVIEIEDDGQGMDIDKIRLKAIEMNLIGPEEHIKERDLLKMVFQPGFSTREGFNQISGMGVGMDVVKESIFRLGGSINLVSTPNIGTKVTISVPITLAIIKVALVKVSTHILAIPLVSVAENLRISSNMIDQVNGSSMLCYKDSYYPLIDLREEFKLKPDIAKNGGKLAIIAGIGDDKVCLRVDSLLEQRDVIIMPLGKILSCIPGLAGAAEIGKKKIALVLDMGYFVTRGTVSTKKDKIRQTSTYADFPAKKERKSVVSVRKKLSLTSSSESYLNATGRFLTFSSASKSFAIDCVWVQEVVKGMSITPIIGTKSIIKGISRFRGRVIPILNLHTKNIIPIEGNDVNKLIIVIEYNGECVGIAIDRVGNIISPKLKKIYKSKDAFSMGKFNYNNKSWNFLNLDLIAHLEYKNILL